MKRTRRRLDRNVASCSRPNMLFLCFTTIVKPKQVGTCGRSIRNEHTSKSLICTNIKCYRTYSIYSLSRLCAILLSITKKTARKWKFGIVNDASCSAYKCFTIMSSTDSMNARKCVHEQNPCSYLPYAHESCKVG